jgi:hypothetical protein
LDSEFRLRESLISYFAEGFVEQANAFGYVGFRNVEHGGEAEDVAEEAAFAD